MSRTIDSMGDDKLRDLFEESFDEQVGKFNNMGDAEAKIVHENDEIWVEVLMTGMAGSPSVTDFKEGTVKDSKKVVVSYDGYDDLEFVNAPEKTVALNVNDYILISEFIKKSLSSLNIDFSQADSKKEILEKILRLAMKNK